MRQIAGALLVTLCAVLATPAAAQVPDHLKCYKVKDALKLGGTVDLNSPQFGADPGCKVSKASLFCVPATKTNVAVTNKATKEPITPLPIEGGASGARPDDRVCYKVKCPKLATPIADQAVTDQFGNRTVSKFTASLVCTPAFKGTARFVDNGNSITDNYTGLQWMETNNGDGLADFANPQDADNTYTWSSSGTAADGTAFTVLLSQLNACSRSNPFTPVFSGFAGSCDWRLPTAAELRTILLPGCPTSPCIDSVFGPTVPADYWSSSTLSDFGTHAWCVDFADGGVFCGLPKSNSFHVRPVRGGSAN